MEDKLKNRNKLIRIAGSSEGAGRQFAIMRQAPWRMTVKMRAESRAVRSDRSQTETRHVTHLILVTLLFGASNTWKASSGKCLPPSFQRQDYSCRGFRAQPTKVHFQEPASPVDHSVISGRPGRTSLESSLPEAQLQSEGTGTAKSELDLEDKYNIASFDNDFILTNDYYEYEQGQKEIIVKRRLKNNIHFLEDCSKSKQFCH